MLAHASISLARESSRRGGKDVSEHWCAEDVSDVEHKAQSEADLKCFDPEVHMA